MKREGRQHGMVRTYPVSPSPWSPMPETRFVPKFIGPPSGSHFTRVPQKPTNHSKFTGKCGRPKCSSCHIHPASKSKDKAKGTHKLRSYDVVPNSRFMACRVGGFGPGLKFSGFSASGMLDQLAISDYNDYDDEVDDSGDDDV